ncbi:GID complex subunit 4, VID24, partial [Lobulomyces angularis]
MPSKDDLFVNKKLKTSLNYPFNEEEGEEEIESLKNKKKNLKQLNNRICKSECSSLYAGSRFYGEQKSGRSSYEVSVDLQYVDLNQSFLCGYLHIKGLTEEFPTLCTFFEAEV